MSRQPFGLRFATALTFPALCLRTLRQGRRRKPKTSRRPKAADEIVKIYLTGEGLLMEAVTVRELVAFGLGLPLLDGGTGPERPSKRRRTRRRSGRDRLRCAATGE